MDPVGPALADALLGPGVVCVLSQLVHDGFLSQGQLDVAEVQRSRSVPTTQLVAAQTKKNHH